MDEFEASLVYRVSSRAAKATLRNPVWKNQEKKSPKSSKIIYPITLDVSKKSLILKAPDVLMTVQRLRDLNPVATEHVVIQTFR